MNEIPTILEEALEIPTASAREEYLRHSCGDDIELRRRVKELLEDYEAAGDFLEVPVTADLTVPGVLEGLGMQIGPYKLREQIGEGGMGIVYLAEQMEPIKRRVALKLVKSGMDTRQVLARFEAERQALAMMSHPHISRILDAGATESGRPYFVMELVRGIPITEYCDQHKLSVRQRLELFIQVCQAVQHAHQRGIIHRDLKPSNILVELHDVVPVPKVIDFGIAKATGQQLTQRTVYTQFVQMIGTPLYMSPEQAQLSGLDIDTRSDIYSLGVILYELLIGLTPFDQKVLTQVGPDEMRRIIREVDPPRPSQKISTLQAAQLRTISDQRQMDPHTLSGTISRELDWVVLQALEKDRERRYESASAMAADLQRYLNDEAVLACPPSLGYQVQKFTSRNKVAIITAAIVTLSLVTGAAVATWQAIVANQERNRANQSAQKYQEESRRAEEKSRIADQQRLRAEAAEQAQRKQTEIAQNALYASAVQLAYRHKQEGDDEQAVDLLDSWIPLAETPDRRGVEWQLLMQQMQAPGTELMNLSGDVSCTRVSPDGTYLVAATDLGVVQRYSFSEQQKIASWESGLGDVRRMEFSPDGRYLALISYDSIAAVIETSTGAVQLRCPAPQKSTKNADVCFFDGRLLTTGNSGLISIWNVEEGKRERIWDTGAPQVLDMATSPAFPGIYLLLDSAETAMRKSQVCVVSKLSEGTFDRQWSFPLNSSALAVGPGGKYLAVGDTAGEIVLLDAEKSDYVTGWQLSEKINELCFSPDGSCLTAAERTGVVHVWDVQKTQPPALGSHRHWQAHARPVRTVMFTPDSRKIISSGFDGRVIQWGQRGQSHVKYTNPLDTEYCQTCVLHGAGAAVVVGARDLRSIVTESGQLMGQHRFIDVKDFDSVLATDETGNWLACASEYGGIYCYPFKDQKNPVALANSGPRQRNHSFLVFLHDAQSLISVERFPTLMVRGWETSQQKLQFEYKREDIPFSPCTVCPHTNELIIVPDEEVLLLDVETGKTKVSWPIDGIDVTTVSVNSKGSILAIGRKDRTIQLVDSHTGKLRQTIRGHLGPPERIQFSADDKTLVVLDERGVLRMWQVASGIELLTWSSASKITHFHLSGDDRFLSIIHGNTLEVFEANLSEN